MKKVQNYFRETDKLIPKGFFNTTRLTLARYGFLGGLARYLMMQDELRKFVQRACSKDEKIFRRELIKKFSLIQKKISCAHSPYQFVLMAEYILNLKADGPIVQCGCYKGGSTAKLSLLAKKTHRHLYVCDSFKGLPIPKSKEELFLEGHGDSPNYAFSVGEYQGSLHEVQENVRRYGCVENCIFIHGLFNESLAKLDIKPAFVFIDVDFISSALDCLRHLWPKLVFYGYWFIHEAIFPRYIAGILDALWWHETLGEPPPVIIGGGSGLSPIAEGIAYFQKKPIK